MSNDSSMLDVSVIGQNAADLLPLVYDELRKLAATRLAMESSAHSLNPTGLVHEAYLRLIGDQQFDHRGHFFAAAAEAMRRILIDHARRQTRLKRGGSRRRVNLDHLTELATASNEDLVELDDALTQMSTDTQRQPSW